ncbi:unnamed protein product [Arctia plantaginis]|uniref:U6 snRNA phosphodiesterase n=1 Tax=Arctia plantaginis TaxID=874455 RepID=A0A8S1B0U5_ARCPL|nr:unnamed protein product [Arctia plantaginis]
MSALSSICEYRSDSEDSDCELDTNRFKRVRLPPPNLSKVPVVPLSEHKDDPELHFGRMRSFPHVRGNWATFVFVQYLNVSSIHDLLDKLEEKVVLKTGSCHKCDNFHISLSKTVVLKYHLISAFSASLQEQLKSIESFELGFVGLKVYCNEENSRTFISLTLDPFTEKYLLAITRKVDQVLEDFKLPTFYEDPSLHMSVLWVHGNKKSELNSIIESMYDTFIEESVKSLKTILVESIHCKVGNKLFQYLLS